MKYDVRQNEYGFYQVSPMPKAEALSDFYAKKYYQRKESGNYRHHYSKAELENLHNISQIAEHIWYRFRDYKGTFLDIGCGEGWFLKYFASKSWEVLGIDFSEYGMAIHNPEMQSNLMKTDLYEGICDLVKNKKQFDFLNCRNVLEHVTDPELLLERVKSLMHAQSILRIEVPNDFSEYQLALKNQGVIDSDYWFCPPEHLSYFSLKSLQTLLKKCGFNVMLAHGDFPIEIFLSNPCSNYVSHKDVGKFAHESRLFINNFIINHSGIDKYIDYVRAGLEAGLSRQIVVYVGE